MTTIKDYQLVGCLCATVVLATIVVWVLADIYGNWLDKRIERRWE